MVTLEWMTHFWIKTDFFCHFFVSLWKHRKMQKAPLSGHLFIFSVAPLLDFLPSIHRTSTYELSRIGKPRYPRFKSHLLKNRQADAKMGQVDFEHFA